MIDQITIDRTNKLHPKIREEVLSLLKQVDVALSGRADVRIVQGLRSFAEQDALYAKGRTKPGPIVTKAKAGQSYHNYGLAFDFALLIDGKEISWNTSKDYDGDNKSDWYEVIAVFEKAGYKSGKSFGDLPHIEKSFGLTWRQLLKKYNNKEFIKQTNYVNI